MLDYNSLEELETAGRYLTGLLSSVLREESPLKLPEGLTWEQIYEMAEAHGVEAMAFYGARDFLSDEPELLEKWKKSRDRNLIQATVQKSECERIFQELFKNGIPFLPMKGFVMRKLYRQEVFRQMSDLDILVPQDKAEEAGELLENLGYRPERTGEEHHDEYRKPPYMSVELHRHMLPEDDLRFSYYENIWEKAVPDETIPGGWKLKEEDFYIYHLAHFEKHLKWLGSGIRPLLDMYVYLEANKGKLDRKYLEKELKVLKLDGFEKEMKTLCYDFFGEKKEGLRASGADTGRLERELFVSGIYGDWDSLVTREIWKTAEEKSVKKYLKFFFGRIFMKRENLKHSYPVLKKHPAMLPFCWIHRGVYILLFKREAVKKELRHFQIRKQ